MLALQKQKIDKNRTGQNIISLTNTAVASCDVKLFILNFLKSIVAVKEEQGWQGTKVGSHCYNFVTPNG